MLILNNVDPQYVAGNVININISDNIYETETGKHRKRCAFFFYPWNIAICSLQIMTYLVENGALFVL